jgi:hypothetical protein
MLLQFFCFADLEEVLSSFGTETSTANGTPSRLPNRKHARSLPFAQPHLIFVVIMGRMANTLGLIPWFGAYFRFLPRFGNGLRNFRAAAIQRVLRRKENGSVRKDLFHHLVSPSPPT